MLLVCSISFSVITYSVFHIYILLWLDIFDAKLLRRPSGVLIYRKMDACFFEYRDYFQKRIKQIEIPANKNKATIYKKPNGETPDSLICARIRPLTAHELEKKHIEGVLGHHDGGVNIYEPRRKVKSKPELNVRLSYLRMHVIADLALMERVRLLL